MGVRPLGDRVLLRRIEPETATGAGIIIAPTAQEKQQQGSVLAVGPGLPKVPMNVAVGETVLFGKYAGVEVKVDGETLVLLNQADVLAVIED